MNLHASAIESWYDFHEKTRGFKPTTFTGRDGKSIKEIINRIKTLIPEPTDENILEFWNIILEQMPKKIYKNICSYHFYYLPLHNFLNHTANEVKSFLLKIKS